jgi:hypothetical protein
MISINERKCTETVKIQSERLARMVVAIFEKRCDNYCHSQEDDYNEVLKAF